MKKLLTGNEAVARGAYEAGVSFVTGYPGTPATEILDGLSNIGPVYAEWSSNEKTALEMASGVSFGGKRSLVVMKQVGLNVASDALMTLSYTGVRGGLVIAVSDDPGMQSSQNEQDSRHYARSAKIPMLEPSDSQEAYGLVKEAFRMSEKFDTPVLLRLTQAVSHSEGVVMTGKRAEFRAMQPVKDPEKYVMLPPYSNQRRTEVERRTEKLKKFSESFRLNIVERASRNIGVITSGISYMYVKEATPRASVLKLSMTYPLPSGLIKGFSKGMKKIFVVEELDPFIEDEVKALGIDAVGKRRGLPSYGEFSVPTVRDFIEGSKTLPIKKPQGDGSLCPGCPYLGVFYHLKGLNTFVFGDIGCYTLAAKLFPGSIDTTLCMGAGISQAAGFLKARPRDRAIAVIGDSTFFHSGIEAAINAFHHQTPLTIIVLDNGTTAMTGGQAHAGSKLSIPRLLKAAGIEDVSQVGPYDLGKIKGAIGKALGSGKLSAVVVKGGCVVREKPKNLEIEEALCSRCMECLGLKCPAIKEDEGTPVITRRCIGCGLCVSLCPSGAIR